MPAWMGKTDAINRGLGRHHVLAGTAALVLSLVLHASLLTRLSSVVLLPSVSAPEVRRYEPITMTDVQRKPPPPMETVPREDIDRPAVDMPLRAGNPDIWSDMATPEPVELPLPPPEPAQEAIAAEPRLPESLPAVRQEVLAIQEQLFSEEVSALPRRWVEAELPRVDRAPDIQLPVELPADPAGSGITGVQPSVDYLEAPESGTPDWSAVLGGRQGMEGGTGILGSPVLPGRATPGSLDEKPEEVSNLVPVEDLLQVRVAGYQAPEDSDGSLYFALAIERASETQLPVQPRDVLFIQDSSESMTPWKLDECRRGLKRWLSFLNPEDRFEIIGFREDTYGCFNGWRDFNPESVREAYEFIDRMRAVGDTDVYRSLESALTIERDPGRTVLLILISDGRPTVGVTGSSDIIEAITRSNQGGVSIFTVGGGKKVNSFFLDLLGYRNRGDAIVAKGDEEIPAAMEKWARQLQRPVLTDLSYHFQAIDETDIYPKQLTHLFLDRPLMIYGRLPAGVDRLVFQVVGRAGSTWHDMVFAVDRSAIAPGPASLRTQWAWQKIYHDIGDYLGNGSEDKLEAIRDFAESYNLVVPYGFSRIMPR